MQKQRCGSVKIVKKQCSSCRKRLALSEFFLSSAVVNGRQNYCKKCSRRANRLYYSRPLAKLVKRRSDKKYRTTVAGKESMRRGVKKYRKTKAGRENARKRVEMYRLRHPERVRLATLKASRTPTGRFNNAKNSARQQGLSWSIGREQFYDLIKSVCFYCGGPLPETASGLDRLDNLLGYEFFNVKPCCRPCNVAKNNIFTADEMAEEIGPAIRRVRLERLKNNQKWWAGGKILKLIKKNET